MISLLTGLYEGTISPEPFHSPSNTPLLLVLSKPSDSNTERCLSNVDRHRIVLARFNVCTIVRFLTSLEIILFYKIKKNNSKKERKSKKAYIFMFIFLGFKIVDADPHTLRKKKNRDDHNKIAWESCIKCNLITKLTTCVIVSFIWELLPLKAKTKKVF